MDNDKQIRKVPEYSVDKIVSKSDLATRGLRELGLLNKWPLENLSEENLRRQYREIEQAFLKTKVIRELELGRFGVESYDGTLMYPMPTVEEVRALVAEKSPELRKKVEQGFTRLLLVPIGAGIGGTQRAHQRTDERILFGRLLKHHIYYYNYSGLIGSYAGAIRSHVRTGTLKYSNGEPILTSQINTDEPLVVEYDIQEGDNAKSIAYGVTAFDSTQDASKLTKDNYIQGLRFPGWEIRLIQDDWNVPAPGEIIEKGGRINLDANGSDQISIASGETIPNLHEWLNFYQNATADPASPYHGEVPLGTVESFLALAIVRLETTSQVLGNLDEGIRSNYYLLQQFIPKNSNSNIPIDRVPMYVWSLGQPYLSWEPPQDRSGESAGVLSSVILG